MSIRKGLICACLFAFAPGLAALPYCTSLGNPIGNRGKENCPVDLVNGTIECPLESGLMAIVELPTTEVCLEQVDAPVPVVHECVPAPGGMVCEGWAQEVSVPKRYLSYSWSVRVGYVTTQYDTGHEAYVDFGCNNGQSVRVTMTVTNGTYSASTQQSYTCGDDIQ